MPETAAEVWTAPSQSGLLTGLKILGVLASAVLWTTLLARIALALIAGHSPWLALPAFVVGYLLADLMSGVAHWFCDTFFDEETPIIGKRLIQPFRDHHVHPGRITGYRFIEQDTANFFLMLVPLAVAFWLGAPRPGSVAALAGWCCFLGLAGGSFCTNLFHKWAHMPQPPTTARWLQASGLILDAERHRHHHRDHSRGFCVTSGWMNPVLDTMRFFPRLERVVRFLQR